jgi:hypothetical protein
LQIQAVEQVCAKHSGVFRFLSTRNNSTHRAPVYKLKLCGLQCHPSTYLATRKEEQWKILIDRGLYVAIQLSTMPQQMRVFYHPAKSCEAPSGHLHKNTIPSQGNSDQFEDRRQKI